MRAYLTGVSAFVLLLSLYTIMSAGLEANSKMATSQSMSAYGMSYSYTANEGRQMSGMSLDVEYEGGRSFRRGGNNGTNGSRNSNNTCQNRYYSSLYKSCYYVPIAYNTSYGSFYYGNAPQPRVCQKADKKCIDYWNQKNAMTAGQAAGFFAIGLCCCVCIGVSICCKKIRQKLGLKTKSERRQADREK